MSSHRVSALVSSCLKTPVNPHTKVPLASYERDAQVLDSVSYPDENGVPDMESNRLWNRSDRFDLQEFYRSGEEYHHKLEELRRAHLQSMSDLEQMLQKKLDLNGMEPPSSSRPVCLVPCEGQPSGEKIKKARSVTKFDMSEQQDVANDDCIHQRFTISSKEQIRNMWKEFSVDQQSSCCPHPSSTKPQNHSPDYQAVVRTKTKGERFEKGKQDELTGWHPRVTVPKPFKMTIREAELKSKKVPSRSEIERENEELRRQIEELTECQRKFRASPVPTHVRLPLYEALQEREKERRRQLRAVEQQRLRDSQRPFSFIERELIKKAQKEKHLQEQKMQEERQRNIFRAKPVPKAVKEAAFGERQKEDELYRDIIKFMRAREMLLGASMPPSVLAKRLAERRARKADELDDRANRRPKINTQVPDFDASYRSFRKQLESKRESRPVTTCEPFDLSTANITLHKEFTTCQEIRRKDTSSSGWHFVTSSPRTSSSSLSSSLLGSLVYHPTKNTDAAKKRQDAIRKVLEQRMLAEEEKKTWQEKQRQKERKLQKLIAKRAQANDPHVTLAQTYGSKLKEFRKQELQRRREFREEMKGIQERVRKRPLLLERISQTNVKLAAERCYTNVLHKCGLSEDFVSHKAPKGQKQDHKSFTFMERPQSHTSPTYRGDEIPDDPRYVDANSLSDDYPADYEDYEPDLEAKPAFRRNITQKDKKIDNESDRHFNPDNDRSHSNTSKESSDGERSKECWMEDRAQKDG